MPAKKVVVDIYGRIYDLLSFGCVYIDTINLAYIIYNPPPFSIASKHVMLTLKDG